MQTITKPLQELWFNSRTPELSWLSNFHPVDIEYEGITYPSVENMYQAQKFPLEQRHLFCNVSAAESKKMAENITCPDEWHNITKLIVMRIGLRVKFSIPMYHEMLDRTGSDLLIHLSPWDLFWGMNKERIGKNVMGNMLMDIRENHRMCNIF